MSTETPAAENRSGRSVEVVHDTDSRFYELLVDGQHAGMVVYGAAGNRYVFTHTFIGTVPADAHSGPCGAATCSLAPRITCGRWRSPLTSHSGKSGLT
jgi:hypothetical protein